MLVFHHVIQVSSSFHKFFKVLNTIQMKKVFVESATKQEGIWFYLIFNSLLYVRLYAKNAQMQLFAYNVQLILK